MNKIVPMYPWPPHQVIRDALAPVEDIRLVEALPGGPGPVLAVKKAPPWVCDAIVVSKPEKLLYGLAVVLSDGLELVSAGDIIGRTMGTQKVIELAPETVLTAAQQAVKFR